MSCPAPQFRAHLKFTFHEHGIDRWQKFVFSEDGHRRVPMSIEGVDGLHTVGLWIDGPREFKAGDETDVNCVVIWPEGLLQAAIPGARFELWDGGFFVNGVVLEKFDNAGPLEVHQPAAPKKA